MGDMFECEDCKYIEECLKLPACSVDAYEKGRKDEHRNLMRAFLSLYKDKEAWKWIEIESKLGGEADD